jgi:hypothetical protein
LDQHCDRSTELSHPCRQGSRCRVPPEKSCFLNWQPVLGIRDFLVRIRIPGSVPLTNGSDPELPQIRPSD